MQKEAWKKEFEMANLASTKREEPSHALLKFIEIVKPNLNNLKIIELGCGNGRNLVYLAKQGASCVGVDFVEGALEADREKVENNGLDGKVELVATDMSESLPFGNGSFDVALDLLSGSSIFDEGWNQYKTEIKRILKAGGYFVVYYPNLESDDHKEYLKTNPGGHPKSFLHPRTGIEERAFSVADIRKEFANFKEVATEIIEFQDKNYDRTGKVSFVFGIFQKP